MHQTKVLATKMLKVGSLFSGIGGIDLGFEREGFKTAWFVDVKPHARAIIAKRWAKATIYGDVTKIQWKEIEQVDILVGGFPCKDLSKLNTKGKGLQGKKSGLWRFYKRAIREIRPKYALIENVPTLINNGLSQILADLASIGYDAEWCIISAQAFGAPHKRERVFILAYPHRERSQEPSKELEEQKVGEFQFQSVSRSWDEIRISFWERIPSLESWVCGVDDGVSNRLERLDCLGNAVVPQVAQYIARRIKEKLNG